MNKKFLIVGVLLLAICVSIGAVSADDDDDGWSFDFSSSDSSNSDGGSVQIKNNVVTIQGFKFTIPDGFKENESAKMVGEDLDDDSLPNCKESTVAFNKGDDRYLISVIYSDTEFDEDTYVPNNNTTAKEIADTDGWYQEYDGGVSFEYIEDGKLVHLFAPDKKGISSLIKSSDDD